MQIKRQTYKQIEDMAKRWNGTITIGLTPERGIQMFTAIYPKIHAMYPEATFQPLEVSVETQINLLDTHQLDFGFQTIYERKYKHLIYDTIFYEPFYLCVPKSHRLAYQERLTPEEYPVISLGEFKDDLFTLVRKSSTMRVVLDKLFERAGFKPKLLFESISMRTMLQLAKSGECCSVIPVSTPRKRMMSPTIPWGRKPAGSWLLSTPQTIILITPQGTLSPWPPITGKPTYILNKPCIPIPKRQNCQL